MTMKRYYIKFSGAAWNISASTPDEAWKQIRKNLDCYCSPQFLEIGKDCDESGWPIKKTLDTLSKP